MGPVETTGWVALGATIGLAIRRLLFPERLRVSQFSGRCQHCQRPMPPDLLVKDETGEATCIWCA